MKDIEKFVNLSNVIGRDAAFVQGGGGNTSVKIDDQVMAIKASGTSLKDMTLDSGIAHVNYNSVIQYHAEPSADHDIYAKDIQSFSINPVAKPSIETGFHALLSKYVIHTHSVFINTLLCSLEGQEILSKIFKSSIWVDYVTPGKDITLALLGKKNLEDASIIFLQNHGMIVSAEDADECLETHKLINERVRAEFQLPEFTSTQSEGSDFHVNFIFPDQVIYTADTHTKNRTPAYIETLASFVYINKEISRLDLTPNYLPSDSIQILKDMESEKYRQKIQL